eukprot:8387201-Alexandrium_andersonii.AAC.1
MLFQWHAISADPVGAPCGARKLFAALRSPLWLSRSPEMSGAPGLSSALRCWLLVAPCFYRPRA